MRAYLAGQMSGKPNFNFDLFNSEAARLRALDIDVVNPAEKESQDGGGGNRCTYMRWDVEALLTVDAVIVLPDWQRSRGARLEVELARQLGLPVLDAATLRPISRQAAQAARYYASHSKTYDVCEAGRASTLQAVA